MSQKKRMILAEAGLLLVTVIWGSGFVVVKNTTDTISSGYIIVFRFGIAALLLGTIFSHRLKKIDRQCLKAGFLLGFLYFLAYYLQTIGVKYTTAGNNAFLTAIYVVLVPFLYWAIKNKKPNRYNLAAAFLCIIGIGLLSLKPGFSINPGDLLSLFGGICFTAQIVATAILTQKNDPILLSVVQFSATTVFASAVALLTEKLPQQPGPGAITGILYLGIFSTLIALLMQTVCQKYIPASRASLIMSLESVFGCLFGVVFLKEILTARTLCGCALIFAAILISETRFSPLRRSKKTDTLSVSGQDSPDAG